MIDYRNLLIKYIQHVRSMGGATHICGQVYDRQLFMWLPHRMVGFTEEETMALCDLEKAEAEACWYFTQDEIDEFGVW